MPPTDREIARTFAAVGAVALVVGLMLGALWMLAAPIAEPDWQAYQDEYTDDLGEIDDAEFEVHLEFEDSDVEQLKRVYGFEVRMLAWLLPVSSLSFGVVFLGSAAVVRWR